MPGDAVTMQSEGYFKVRIESVTFGRLVGCVGLFVGVVLFFLVAGAMAPEIFLSSPASPHMQCRTIQCEPTFHAYLNRLTKYHQVFYQEMTVHKWKGEGDYSVAIAAGLEREGVTPERRQAWLADRTRMYEMHAREEAYSFDLEVELVVFGEDEPSQPRSDMKVIVGHKLADSSCTVANGHPGGPPCYGGEKRTFRIHCEEDEEKCEPVVVFSEEFLHFTGYHLELKLKHPFIAAGVVDYDGVEQLVRQMGDNNCNMDIKNDEKVQAEHEDDDCVAKYHPHDVTVDFQMKYVNRKFTIFLLWTKYIALAVSLIVLGILGHGLMTKLESKYWSFEQMWVLILSITLILFNDPLYVLEIFVPTPIFTGLAALGIVTMLTTMLFFWVCVFDIVRSPSYWMDHGVRKLDMCFYLPKVILCFLIWMGTVGLYMYVRLQAKRDPTFFAQDNPTYDFLYLMVAVVVGLYVLYCLGMIVLAIYKGWTLGWPPQHFMFIFLLSVVSLIMAVIGLFIGAFEPEVIYASEYTTFVGSINAYCWIMAWAYYPAPGANSATTGGAGEHAEFHDEDGEIQMTDASGKHDAIDNLGDALGDGDVQVDLPMSP